PGFGDGIQLMKAGVMEIADIYCLNKADLSGADQLRGDLRGFIASLHKRPWAPPLVATVATTGQGVGDLWEAVERHRARIADLPEAEGRRSQRLCDEAAELVGGWARRQAVRILEEDSSLRGELEAGNDPQAVLARLAGRLRWPGPGGTG
ncbi:MAG: methylmalonyl Co-A mutase-associated GTPase MeaB, partial [Candidatus Dormibacteraceae bacterium]